MNLLPLKIKRPNMNTLLVFYSRDLSVLVYDVQGRGDFSWQSSRMIGSDGCESLTPEKGATPIILAAAAASPGPAAAR